MTAAGTLWRRWRGRPLLPRLRRAYLLRSVGAALAIAVSRFLALLGAMFLLFWSYSIWGSTTSPLAYLLVPGIVLIALAFALRIILHWLIRWTRRYSRIGERRSMVQEKIRMSQIVRLPRDDD